MATLRNYGAALGASLKDSAKGIVSGFGSGIKGAMLSEVPLLTAGFGAFSSLRKDANNMGSQQSTSATPAGGSGSGSGSQTNSSITGNPFARMIQQLAQINANTAFSARADKASLQAEQYKQTFGEEEARERAQQNKALIDAIKNSGLGGSKGKTEEGSSESPFGKFFGGIIGNIGKLLLKAFRGLGAIIVAGFTAAMPFLRKMLTKVLSFALKRALFLIPGIGLILGTAALAYDVADMAGAFDGGDGGGNAGAGGGNAGADSKKGGGLSMIDRARLSMGIPAGGTSPSGNNAKKDPKERQAPNSSSPRPLTAQQEGNKTSGLTWRVPVTVPYIVTSEFEEISPSRDFRSHNGIDLAIREGEYIVAAAEGKLLAAGTNKLSGNFVSMDHGNGLVTSYCHLMDLSIANAILSSKDKEQIIKVGQPIGFCGKTGGDGTMRPHLHFMIRRAGTPVNPRIYIDFGPKNKKTSPDEKGAGLYGAPPAGDSSKASSTNAGANSSSVVAKRVTVPSLSSTPLIEMGDGRVAEAYAAAGVNSPSPMTSAQVAAAMEALGASSYAGGSGYYKQRKTDANNQRVIKELGGIRENTHKTFKEVKSNRITMSGGKFKSPALLLAEANKQFRDSLQKQLTRTISGSLMKALYPGGYKNVSQQTASGQMYRGEQLNKMLGVTPALTKLGTSIFGKQYGPAFGQIFSKVGTAYMEVGARSVAQGIFGSAFKSAGMKDGVAEDQANILGGQILGNLAKGTKAGKLTALEQIIYGASGGKVALGPETIFAKYGFASPADGIGYMANVLGAGIMGPIDSALGTTPSSMGNMDPRMKQMGAFGGYGGEYGGLPSNMVGAGSSRGNLKLGDAQNALAANPAFAYDNTGRLSSTTTSPEAKLLVQQINAAKDAEAQAKKNFIENNKSADARTTMQTIVADAQLEQEMKSNELLAEIAKQRSGSGSSAGGFFNKLLNVQPGDKGMMGAFAEVGNMALDFGKAALTQKVVQKLGIKNPYMQMLASAAVNKGLSIGGEYAFNAIKGTETGSSIINYASTALAGVKSAFPSIFGTSAAPTAANISAAGMEALGVSSYAGGTAALTGTAAAGTAAAASGALTTSSTGIAADAFLTANMGGGAAAAGASPWLAAVPQIAVAIVVAKLATDLFFRLTRSKSKPVMSRIIRVLENNNINAKTFSNVDSLRGDVPPKEWQPAADSLLNVGFNATKSAEVETKEKSPYEFIMVTIENDGIKFHADSGDPKTSKQFVALGKLDNTFNSSTAASTIVKFVADIFKREYVAKSAQVDKAVTDLNKLTYAEIGNQLASSLKSKIDTSVSAGVFGTLEQDKQMADYKFNKKIEEQYIQGENSSQDAYITPQVYSQKEGKYVEAPSTMVDQKVTDEYGNESVIKVKQYTPDVLMLDKDGNPIYDVDQSGGLNTADFVTPAKSTVSATVIANSAEVAGASATKGVTVNTVSDSSTTTTDQSQNTYYTGSVTTALNAISDASVNTGMPA